MGGTASRCDAVDSKRNAGDTSPVGGNGVNYQPLLTAVLASDAVGGGRTAGTLSYLTTDLVTCRISGDAIITRPAPALLPDSGVVG